VTNPQPTMADQARTRAIWGHALSYEQQPSSSANSPPLPIYRHATWVARARALTHMHTSQGGEATRTRDTTCMNTQTLLN